jgi:hypothetical protein
MFTNYKMISVIILIFMCISFIAVIAGGYFYSDQQIKSSKKDNEEKIKIAKDLQTASEKATEKALQLSDDSKQAAEDAEQSAEYAKQASEDAEQAAKDAEQELLKKEQDVEQVKQLLLESSEAEKSKYELLLRTTEQEARKAEEQTRLTEEKARITEEKSRITEEKARKAEENLIKAEEQARKAEEQTRKAEEKVIKAEEQAKKAEEQTRKAEEQAKKAKDSITSILTSKAQEQTRKAQEQTRKAQEQAVPSKTEEQSGLFSSPISMTTPLNNTGQWESKYLDRHNIKCSTGNALSQFRLKTDGKSKMQYIYKCVSGGDFETPVMKNSEYNKDYNAKYLDRLNVDCGTNSVLSQASLSRKKGNLWRYNYTCNNSKKPLTCRNLSTKINSNGGGRVNYLDKHDVKCGPDEALSQFKLVGVDSGNYKYDYTCCSATEPKYTMSKDRDSKGSESNFYCKKRVSESYCRQKCDGTNDCKGYSYINKGSVWGDDFGCCFKRDSGPLKEQKGVDFYTKFTDKVLTLKQKDFLASKIKRTVSLQKADIPDRP